MSIRITVKNDKLDVDPDTERVMFGESTEWEVEVGSGRSVEILFKNEHGADGPFEHKAGDADNPKRGRYKKAKGRIKSHKVDQKGAKTWKYDVVLWEGGAEVDRKDPYIKVFP